MKILVIGGMHGNEMLGIDLVKSLQESPLENIDSVLANEEAIKINKRFVNQDLNRSFPGVESSGIYEQQRPVKLLEMCKDYDIVFDFHNTFCPDIRAAISAAEPLFPSKLICEKEVSSNIGFRYFS